MFESIAFTLVTACSTTFGGLLALRMANRASSLLAITAGVLLGVVFLDILPDAYMNTFNIGLSVYFLMLALLGGYVAFSAVESFIHVHAVEHPESALPGEHSLGVLSASGLVMHSFTDGLGIGIGFEVSHALGIAIAIAVIGHDMVDGFNTVTLMEVHGNPRSRTILLLLLDAIAPIAGAVTSYVWSPSLTVSTLFIGFFAGVLLRIGCGATLQTPRRQNGLMFERELLLSLGIGFVFFTVALV
jgi:zinc transporter ZupT